MAAEENQTGRRNRPVSLAARKIRGRPRHGTELSVRLTEDTSPRARHVSQTRFPTKPDTPRSSEPILIPKLRIQFADFPYLHYFID